MFNYGGDFLQFCMDNPHFCRSHCKEWGAMVLWCRKEVNGMGNKKTLIAKVARKAAEKALRKDANRTTCLAFYQPKAPADLKRFKNGKY